MMQRDTVFLVDTLYSEINKCMLFRHLKEIKMGYLPHLIHAWRMSAILFIHGLIPSIWETKVSDEIQDAHNKCKK